MTEPWIQYGSFKFGNVDMYETFGLRVTDCDYDYLSPAPRERKMDIPLRSGAYRFEEKYHEERQILLSVRSEVEQGRDYWRELSFALDKTANLYIYSEPDKYYTGRIYDPSQLKRVRNTAMDFDLIFTCRSYAYGLAVTQNFENNVYYPNCHGTVNSPTIITIKNTGSVPVSGIRIILQNKRS